MRVVPKKETTTPAGDSKQEYSGPAERGLGRYTLLYKHIFSIGMYSLVDGFKIVIDWKS